MRVVLVGGGVFGQVIAWRLALRGHEVVLVEPGAPGGFATGSGDRTRIVRALYGEERFALSGHRSLELFSAWSEELGARLVDPLGVLYLDADEGSVPEERAPEVLAFRAWLGRGVAHVRALGGVVHELGRDALRERYPALASSTLRGAVLEPAAGAGRATLTTRLVARAALRTGRVEHTTAEVEALALRGGRAVGARLRGPGATLEGDVVLVAAGYGGAALVAQALELPSPAAAPLGIRRLPHFTTTWDVPWPAGAELMAGALPAWADLGRGLYGFPDDGEQGFKVAWHEPRRGLPPSGARVADLPDATELERLRERATLTFPALSRATLRAVYPCAYDATDDESFRLGWVPGLSGAFFVGGMSGHGFKHAPALGESVAQVLSGEPPLVPLEPHALPG
jgi:sarcosine oxidase